MQAAGESIEVNRLIGYAPDGSGGTKVWKVDANADLATNTTPFVCAVSADAYSSSYLVRGITSGEVATTAADWTSSALPSTADSGKPVWADPVNPGMFTMSAPVTTGYWKNRIGYLSRVNTSTGKAYVFVQIGDPVKL